MTEQPSRRNFLKTASLGVAAVGVSAGAPAAFASSERPSNGQEPTGPTHDGAVTAYIRDHRTGEISVLAGEHEVTLHDRLLAQRLARIAARAQS